MSLFREKKGALKEGSEVTHLSVNQDGR